MFFKKRNKKAEPLQSSGIKYDTLIGEGITAENLNTYGKRSIRVSGTVLKGITKQAGNLTVVISEYGVVKGTVSATTVFVEGTLEGDVFASDVHLSSTAKLTGDVYYAGRLQIEAGASLTGQVHKVEVAVADDDEQIQRTVVAPYVEGATTVRNGSYDMLNTTQD